MIHIVLKRPEVAGNIGAVVRVMSNFGFSKLVIINPKCDILSKESLDRAKHAKNILKSAKIGGEELLASFDYIIGTTSQLGTDYNIPRSPLTPRQLAEKLSKIKGRNIALVFGPEGQGLSNKEILQFDFIVNIPAVPGKQVMNLSHAAAIILYEIFISSSERKHGEHILPASKKEKEHLLLLINRIIDNATFRTPQEKETQRRIWKRIVGKSLLTKREAFALFGFLRKFEKQS